MNESHVEAGLARLVGPAGQSESAVSGIPAAEIREEIVKGEDSALLLTADCLAKLLRVSKRTLTRLRSAGKLPRPVELGRCVRWRADEVRRWIDAGCPALAIWEPIIDRSRSFLSRHSMNSRRAR